MGAAHGHPVGSASFVCVGFPGSGTQPCPTARHWGVRPWPATHWLLVRCAGVGARFSLAPAAAPAFLVCCARLPAVVAWHPFLSFGCGWCVPLLRASWPCLSAAHHVRSGLSLCSGWLPHFRGAFTDPRGSRPRIYSAAARGTLRPAENLAHGACRWPMLRQGRWARSPRTCSRPRDGIVPGGSLRLRSWAACAAVVWRVWTRSLTHPVSRTTPPSTGDPAGGPGLFHFDANNSAFRSEDATPAPDLSFGHFVILLWSAPSGLGLPLGFVFSFVLSLPRCWRLCCLWRFVLSGPGCPWPWRSAFSPAPPAFASYFFFPPCFSSPPWPCALMSVALGFSCSRAWLSLALALCGFLPSPPCCVRCAFSCPLLPCPVLWLPASCCCGLLHIVRCLFWLLSVSCAVQWPAVGCLLYAVPRLWWCSPAALFALWLAFSPWAAFPPAVLCAWSLCCAALCVKDAFSGPVWCRCVLCCALGPCLSP